MAFAVDNNNNHNNNKNTHSVRVHALKGEQSTRRRKALLMVARCQGVGEATQRWRERVRESQLSSVGGVQGGGNTAAVEQ